MITRVTVRNIHDGRTYRIVQVGAMLYVEDLAGTRTGEEHYLPNGWTSVDDIRSWLVECGYVVA
jgi:hypothetical protein